MTPSIRMPAALVAIFAMVFLAPACRAEAPVYGYEIVNIYPHDAGAFTQGLFYLDGYLYESTGRRGQSSIRKVDLKSGEVIQKRAIPDRYFGEGAVNWEDKIISVTWRAGAGFVYDLETFEVRSRFTYRGEGWGLTQDGASLIMSDGTNELRFLDPETFDERRRIAVTYNGRTVPNLNELEWVDGEIFANIWRTHLIARIDPQTGAVVGWLDLGGLADIADPSPDTDHVLNGIAYDAAGDRLFVTGKNWPKLFEIDLVEKAPRR